MDEFKKMLEAERMSVERFVRFRLSSKADADDVLQEIFLSAYQKLPQLKNKGAFKAWMISIARNKCNDYFRKKAAQHEIPIDEIKEISTHFKKLADTNSFPTELEEELNNIKKLAETKVWTLKLKTCYTN